MEHPEITLARKQMQRVYEAHGEPGIQRFMAWIKIPGGKAQMDILAAEVRGGVTPAHPIGPCPICGRA